jgi:hypothetical protein
MNPRELVSAVLRHDDLTARQFVKDAKRAGFSWEEAPAPDLSDDETHRAVYASLVELLAGRNGETAPAWTRHVGAAPKPVFLMGEKSFVLRAAYAEQSPSPLKSRNVIASPDYLDVL